MLSFASFTALFASFFINAETPAPPVAPAVPFELKQHGDVRKDPYFWLRDRGKPETLAYLNAENDYANAKLNAFANPAGPLVEEMKSHVKQEDSSLPFKRGAYEYWNRYQVGKEYPVFLRRPVDQAASEQIVLDQNALAVGHVYTNVGAHVVSDDGRLLAYSLDLKGDRLHTIQIKNLETGRPLDDVISDTSGEIAWAADNIHLFYVKLEPQTLRPRWVYRHRLGESKDTLVFEEKDEKYNVSVFRSLSRRLIFIATASKESTEYSIVDAGSPLGLPKVFQSRLRDVQYQVVDGVDRYYVLTNLRAENFRVVEVPLDHTSVEHWTDVLSHHADTFIQDLWVFHSHLVAVERHAGLVRFRLVPRGRGPARIIRPDLADYSADSGANAEYETPFFRYEYEGLASPARVIDVDLASGHETVRKVDEVPGGFKAANYEVKRLYARAADKTKIPISLVYRKGFRKGAASPLLLYGYGSYGTSIDSFFSPSRLAMLDHGFIYAIAHPRGGSELGRPWYLAGKLMKKKNTFSDFNAVAHYLIQNRWTTPRHLYAQGESAGGLLMGAAINLEPKLFHGVIAKVPFVDVVSTMLDASLPLTTEEYEEWGNPNDKPAYDYIKSYSPYDNVKPGPFPHLFVRAGLNDSQVGYWEPAKWVAKIRKLRTNHNLLIFKTEMGAGHQGKNGRFSHFESLGEDLSFLLEMERTNDIP